MDEPIKFPLAVIRPESISVSVADLLRKPILGARGDLTCPAQRVIVGLNPEYAVQNGATL